MDEVEYRFNRALQSFNNTNYHPDTKLDEILEDSLEIVEFVIQLEHEFDIEINDDEIEKLDTVHAALQKVKNKVNAKQE